MSKELSSFRPLEGLKNGWVAERGTLRCSAIALNDRTICIYSPVSGISEQSLKSLRALGDVKFLLAPNHYHYKGLAEYSDAFPDAQLVCSTHARPRLEKQTGFTFMPLESLSKLLPSGATILEPEGLKTGEVWFDLRNQEHRSWIVTDAFKGSGKARDIPSDSIELLGSFPSFGIADRSVYFQWLSTQLGSGNVQTIIPCHGAVASNPTLGKQALELVQALQK